jgi:hypothetical protein
LLKRKEDVSLEEKAVHEDVKTTLPLCDSEWTEVVKKKNKQSVQTNAEVKLSRNRMCNSVGTGEPCEHGENCRFAHNWDELVVSECTFGSECKHVKKQSEGVYTVVEGKYCKYKHPKETKESVCIRFGMTVVNIIDIKPKQPRSIMKESVKRINVDTVKETKDNDDQEVVIRVQKELAVQALEIVVKAGKNKIRVEFI